MMGCYLELITTMLSYATMVTAVSVAELPLLATLVAQCYDVCFFHAAETIMYRTLLKLTYPTPCKDFCRNKY